MRREAHLVENEWVKGEWTDEAVYAMPRPRVGGQGRKLGATGRSTGGDSPAPHSPGSTGGPRSLRRTSRTRLPAAARRTCRTCRTAAPAAPRHPQPAPHLPRLRRAAARRGLRRTGRTSRTAGRPAGSLRRTSPPRRRPHPLARSG